MEILNEKTMPNFTIVQFSKLGNRMDAPFHILRVANEPRSEQIAAKMTKEEATKRALDMLDKMPSEFRKDLAPLVRSGSKHGPYLADYERAVEEYPFLALAVIEQKIEDITRHYEAEAAKAQQMTEYFTKPIDEA